MCAISVSKTTTEKDVVNLLIEEYGSAKAARTIYKRYIYPKMLEELDLAFENEAANKKDKEDA